MELICRRMSSMEGVDSANAGSSNPKRFQRIFVLSAGRFPLREVLLLPHVLEIFTVPLLSLTSLTR
jgi:hypothetical protein